MASTITISTADLRAAMIVEGMSPSHVDRILVRLGASGLHKFPKFADLRIRGSQISIRGSELRPLKSGHTDDPSLVVVGFFNCVQVKMTTNEWWVERRSDYETLLSDEVPHYKGVVDASKTTPWTACPQDNVLAFLAFCTQRLVGFPADMMAYLVLEALNELLADKQAVFDKLLLAWRYVDAGKVGMKSWDNRSTHPLQVIGRMLYGSGEVTHTRLHNLESLMHLDYDASANRGVKRVRE